MRSALSILVLLSACGGGKPAAATTTPPKPAADVGDPGIDPAAAAAPDPQDSLAADPDHVNFGPDEPAAPPPSAQTPAGAPAYAAAILAAHNRLRARHCAAPLSWSSEIAQVAQRWADHLVAAGCAFEHSGGELGENLAAGTSGHLTPEHVVEMWYGEIAAYRFGKGGFSMETGHFTQVVWKGSQRLGCGLGSCNGMDVWVCNYDPAGNYQGQYEENVLPEGCK